MSHTLTKKPQLPNDCYFQAIGTVQGVFVPSDRAQPKTGSLTLDDGMEFSAALTGKATQSIALAPQQLDTTQIWRVYPKTFLHQGKPQLRFQLTLLVADEQVQPLNQFKIRGLIAVQAQEERLLGVRLWRNRKSVLPIKPWWIWMNGELPEKAIGQFWELSCTREGSQLLMKEAKHLYSPPLRRSKSQRPKPKPKHQEASPPSQPEVA